MLKYPSVFCIKIEHPLKAYKKAVKSKAEEQNLWFFIVLY